MRYYTPEFRHQLASHSFSIDIHAWWGSQKVTPGLRQDCACAIGQHRLAWTHKPAFFVQREVARPYSHLAKKKTKTVRSMLAMIQVGALVQILCAVVCLGFYRLGAANPTASLTSYIKALVFSGT